MLQESVDEFVDGKGYEFTLFSTNVKSDLVIPSSEVFWEKSGKTGIFEKPDVVISVS